MKADRRMRPVSTRLPILPFLLLASAVLFWAGNWVAARALRFDAPPVALAFWRWTIALVLLLPVVAPVLRTQWQLLLYSWKTLCLRGLLATVLQHVPIYIGLKYTTATNGAILNAISPILIILLSWAFIGEQLSRFGIAGIFISLGGVFWIITRGDFVVLATLDFNTGDIWILLATLSWAGYTVCLRWRPAKLDPLVFLTGLAAVGVAAMVPIYALEIASGAILKVNIPSILGIAYIGIFATVLAYIFWNKGVQQVGPSRAGPFMYLMPVFTPLLSIAFLNEAPRVYHGVGIILIFWGIYLTSRPAPSAGLGEINSRSKS